MVEPLTNPPAGARPAPGLSGEEVRQLSGLLHENLVTGRLAPPPAPGPAPGAEDGSS